MSNRSKSEAVRLILEVTGAKNRGVDPRDYQQLMADLEAKRANRRKFEAKGTLVKQDDDPDPYADLRDKIGSDNNTAKKKREAAAAGDARDKEALEKELAGKREKFKLFGMQNRNA